MAMLRARIVQHLRIEFDPGVRLETVRLLARADSQMQHRSRAAATATTEPATVPGNLRGRKDSALPPLASARSGERTLVPMRPVRTRLCSPSAQKPPARAPSGESRSGANRPRWPAIRPSLRGRRLVRRHSVAEIFSNARSCFLGLTCRVRFQPAVAKQSRARP